MHALPQAAKLRTPRPRLDELTNAIIGAAQRVHTALAPGFLESVYERALEVDLGAMGVATTRQHSAHVLYRGTVVGTYVADMVVGEAVLVEIKAIESIGPAQRAQCLNYLRATGLRVGLLLNFGAARLEIRRVVNGY